MDPKTSAARPLLSGKTLMIVEKDYFLQDDVHRLLIGFGSSIVTADSIIKAIEIVDAGGIDGAIVDIEIDAEQAFSLVERLEAAGIAYVFACGEAFAAHAPTFGGFVLSRSTAALNAIALALFARVEPPN